MTARGSGAEISLAAVDLGASSGRVILGRVGPDRLEMTEVARFRNGPIALPDGLYWDVLGLYQDVLLGLRDVARRDSALAGIAIDSWGLDYGLIDSGGMLIGNPRHYRDNRSETAVGRVHARVPPAQLYRFNGTQALSFNTVYQFAADTGTQRPGVQALMMPDLLGFWLTGARVTEQTNASTTGLLDATTGTWSAPLLKMLNIAPALLPEVVLPGATVGELTSLVMAETGLTHTLPVTTVGSHDTASAILGVPAKDEHFAYISCGTWGLVGLELDHPVLTEEARAAGFTNERGVDGTVDFLSNVMGLWLLTESIRTWRLHGLDIELGDLLAQAARLPLGGPLIDPDHPALLPPGDMPSRIVQACVRTGQRVPGTPAEITRCVLDSLAHTFAARIAAAQKLTGRDVRVIQIIGGGSQNELLCQLVTDAAGLPVIAGPVEATALGNVLLQARTHGAVAGDRWALRARLHAAIHTRSYTPARPTTAAATRP